MTDGKVLGLFPPPERTDCLRAVSRSLLRLRSQGWTCEALGRELGCSKDTIENASNEASLLSFDSLARPAFKFPEEFRVVEDLWLCRAPAPPTLEDRLERIEREAAAIRRGLAA